MGVAVMGQRRDRGETPWGTQSTHTRTHARAHTHIHTVGYSVGSKVRSNRGCGKWWVWCVVGVVCCGFGVVWAWCVAGVMCCGCGVWWVWWGVWAHVYEEVCVRVRVRACACVLWALARCAVG